MIALYDHLVSLLVAGVILLLLIITHMRAQQTSVERTMIYVAKKQVLELADILERDFSNAGYGTAPGQSGITAFNTRADGVTDTLAFWGSNASGTQVEIRYVASVVDTVIIDGETRPLFELQRFERTGGVWSQVGGSTQTLTNFSVDLLNANNIPTTLTDVKRLRIRLSNAVFPNIGQDDYLQGYRRLHWGVTLTPANLGGYQGG